MTDYKELTDGEWKSRLGSQQYEVTRHAGTEPAFTGKFWDHHEDGTYVCLCCNTPLFNSSMKFDSGCGWPSFFEELGDAKIERRVDSSHGRTRVEIVCSTCDAHLGHVFEDGPEPTGERYCVNSASLDFAGGGKGPDVGSAIHLPSDD